MGGELSKLVVAIGVLLAVAGCNQGAPSGGAAAQNKAGAAPSTSADPPSETESAHVAEKSSGPSELAARIPASTPPARQPDVAQSERTEDAKSADASATAETRATEAAPSTDSPRSEGVELVAAKVPLDEVQTADLKMPAVGLTKAHADTCRVKVGDTLPDVQLATPEGSEQPLAKSFGKKLTVVLFWNGSKPTALEELRDLQPDVLGRFGGNGVAVIGVNTGDEPQVARDLVKQAGASFPQLSDPQGEAFKQLATTKVPRTYLVDPAGKVVWFDLEYSRTTRRELVQAIRYLLAHQ
jgi:peroxiredoxin